AIRDLGDAQLELWRRPREGLGLAGIEGPSARRHERDERQRGVGRLGEREQDLVRRLLQIGPRRRDGRLQERMRAGDAGQHDRRRDGDERRDEEAPHHPQARLRLVAMPYPSPANPSTTPTMATMSAVFALPFAWLSAPLWAGAIAAVVRAISRSSFWLSPNVDGTCTGNWICEGSPTVAKVFGPDVKLWSTGPPRFAVKWNVYGPRGGRDEEGVELSLGPEAGVWV